MHGEETSVELVCIDGEGNTVTFRFTAFAAESTDDGVFNFSDAKLTSFSFDPSDGSQGLDIDEVNLNHFNAEHSWEMTEIVSNYADVDVNAPVDLEEVGKIIDGIQADLLQTDKNYVDKKPVNPAIRVDAESLDKFVRETEEFLSMYPKDMPHQMKQDYHDARFSSDDAYYAMMSPEQRMQITTQVAIQLAKEYNVEPEEILTKSQYNEKAFQIIKDKVNAITKEKRLAALNEKDGLEAQSMMKSDAEEPELSPDDEAGLEAQSMMNTDMDEGDYPNPIGKEIKPQSSYPKKRKKRF